MAKRTKRISSTSVTVTTAASSRTNEFNPDYSVVKKDLKRIGVLAGVFTVVLIILSFIIP